MSCFKRLLRVSVERALRRFGYKLAAYPSEPPVDLRSVCNHPLAARYFSVSKQVLITVEVSRGRGLRTFPLDASTHPFVFALQSAALADDPKSCIRAALRAYYELTQPTSAAEWLDLPAGSSPLSHQPPWAVSMPWDVRTPEQWRAANERYALQENLEHHVTGERLTINSGWHFWGPVTEQKLEIETRRLHDLATSLSAHGLVRHDGEDGDVCAVVLERDHDWRWQVLGGEHRAAAFSALGFVTMPVRVLQVVSRHDVDVWPGVVRGIFTRTDALATFDRVFEGRLPRVARRWQTALARNHRPTISTLTSSRLIGLVR